MQELYREIPQHEIKPQQIDNQYALRQPLVSSGFSWSGAYAGTYLTVKTPLGEEKTNGRIPLDDEALQQTEQDILEKLAAQDSRGKEPMQEPTLPFKHPSENKKHKEEYL